VPFVPFGMGELPYSVNNPLAYGGVVRLRHGNASATLRQRLARVELNDRLIDALWGDLSAPAGALRRLQVAVAAAAPDA
jgi:hypothetical protein